METKFHKRLLFINSLVPLAILSWDWWTDSLGANPVEYFLRTTGMLTLIFLLLSLSITPLRKVSGWNQLIKFRRMIGLFAFFYGCVHLVTYSIFDKSLDLSAIVSDVWERPFIAFGMTALAILTPLAVTSTNGMIKRLGGKNWQRLHRIVYAAGIFGVIHFYMIQKSDIRFPVVFGAFLALLLLHRLVGTIQKSTAVRAN